VAYCYVEQRASFPIDDDDDDFGSVTKFLYENNSQNTAG
jgi:hypothetical protein